MAQDYDKIIKENIENIILPFTRRLLGTIPDKLEEIPDDLQRTIERRPDFLKKATSGGEIFILHIEFQTEDEIDMVYRMLEYYSMLLRRYNLPIKQYVVYLKANTATMPTRLQQSNLSFEFSLIHIHTINYQEFLASDIPEEVILAILANFDGADAETVIDALLERIKELQPETNRRRKCVRQVEILSKLRQLQKKTLEKINTMPIYYDLREDLRYKQGAEEKEQEMLKIMQEKEQEMLHQQKQKEQEMLHQQKQTIKNLINKGFSNAEIVEIMGVSLALVEDVRRENS